MTSAFFFEEALAAAAFVLVAGTALATFVFFKVEEVFAVGKALVFFKIDVALTVGMALMTVASFEIDEILVKLEAEVVADGECVLDKTNRDEEDNSDEGDNIWVAELLETEAGVVLKLISSAMSSIFALSSSVLSATGVVVLSATKSRSMK